MQQHQALLCTRNCVHCTVTLHTVYLLCTSVPTVYAVLYSRRGTAASERAERARLPPRGRGVRCSSALLTLFGHEEEADRVDVIRVLTRHCSSLAHASDVLC